MAPVAIALVRNGLGPAATVFIGRFGSRGQASLALGLVYLRQELTLQREPTIQLAVIVTVLVSIFAHGFSAGAGSELYARSIKSLASTAPALRTFGE
jgi:NhaP-type Na+/H+ or K+/H+ antiporter